MEPILSSVETCCGSAEGSLARWEELRYLRQDVEFISDREVMNLPRRDVLVLCTGCQGMAGSSAVPPPPTTQVNTGDTAGFDQQLDQLQSTLDSVQAQINSDATP